jgi:hypothetical protein
LVDFGTGREPVEAGAARGFVIVTQELAAQSYRFARSWAVHHQYRHAAPHEIRHAAGELQLLGHVQPVEKHHRGRALLL